MSTIIFLTLKTLYFTFFNLESNYLEPPVFLLGVCFL